MALVRRLPDDFLIALGRICQESRRTKAFAPKHGVESSRNLRSTI